MFVYWSGCLCGAIVQIENIAAVESVPHHRHAQRYARNAAPPPPPRRRRTIVQNLTLLSTLQLSLKMSSQFEAGFWFLL